MNRREFDFAKQSVGEIPINDADKDLLAEWRKMAVWTYCHASEVPSARLFDNIIQCLQADLRVKYWRVQYSFYVHPEIIERFYYILRAGPQDPRLKEFLLRHDGVYYRGIRLIGVPSISTELPPKQRGLLPGRIYTEAFLGDPDNTDPNAVVWAQDIRHRIAEEEPE